MKKLIIFLCLIIFSNYLVAQKYISGDISNNTIWTKAESPYIINNNINIINARLKIEPGVQIIFNKDFYIKVMRSGELVCIGNEKDSIKFFSDLSTHSGRFYFTNDAIGTKFTNDTNYINGSIFKYTKFENLGDCENASTSSISANFIHNVDLLFDRCSFNNLEAKNSNPAKFIISFSSNSQGIFNNCSFSNLVSVNILGNNNYNVIGNKIFNSSFNTCRAISATAAFPSRIYIDNCKFENIQAGVLILTSHVVYDNKIDTVCIIKNSKFVKTDFTDRFLKNTWTYDFGSPIKTTILSKCYFDEIGIGQSFIYSDRGRVEIDSCYFNKTGNNGVYGYKTNSYLFVGDTINIKNSNLKLPVNQKIANTQGDYFPLKPTPVINLTGNYWQNIGGGAITDSNYLMNLCLDFTKNKLLNIIKYGRLNSTPIKGVFFNTPPIIYDTSITINDTIDINSKITTLRYSDQDSNKISFKILAGNLDEFFSIGQYGNINIIKKLEYNKINKFELLISANDGVDSSTAKVIINIKPIPVINYPATFSICNKDSLKVYTKKYFGYSILWYKNNQVFNNQNIDTIFLKEAAEYQIKIIKTADTIASEIKKLFINAIPSSPSASNKNLCQNDVAIPLSATSTSDNILLWYGTNEIGGSSSTTAPILSTASTGTVNYFVSQKNSNTGCESTRTKITVNINPTPLSPTVRDTIYCNNTNADTLKAITLSSHSLYWYGINSTGGTPSAFGSKPNTSVIGSFNYYVSQKNNTTGCESTRAKIKVIINPLPLAPIVKDTSYCNNAISDTLRVNATSGSTLLWYGNNATGGTGNSIAIKPSTTSVGTAMYYVSQIITASGCEGPRSKISVTTKPIPSAPAISRDSANNLVANINGITWFKDGLAISDTTQKFKPSIAGSYTAKTTLNGCTSVLSAAYYYLVTDIINLSKDEYIKLAPNPFINQISFDFVLKGYQRLNIEVFDVATGTKVASQPNLIAGSRITLGQLSEGTYIIRVTSNDQKIVQQFKVMKM
jgi:hypothetical protein